MTSGKVIKDKVIKPYKLSTTCAIGLFFNGRTFLKTGRSSWHYRAWHFVVGEQAASVTALAFWVARHSASPAMVHVPSVCTDLT